MTDTSIRQPPPCERRWMPYAQAAKYYIGVSPDILLRAIKAHELLAYEKPRTYEQPEWERKNHSYFVNLSDVDEYIRTHWPPAFPPSY